MKTKRFAEFADLRAHRNNHCSIHANAQEAFAMYTRTVYSAEMPETIPRRVLIGRAIENVANAIRLILRGILVALIWFVMLPYFTIWIWRLYFWIGESFAFRLNGLETPLWNSTSFFAQKQNITAVAAESVPTTETDRARDGISQLLFQSVAPEYQWISIFVLDCFEGQIISSVVVVVFVAIFLLREWVVQNQREGVVLDDAIAPLQGVEPDARGFNVEHAVERFIAVQHHIEAVVEGEADLSDDDDDDDDDNDEREVSQSSQSQTDLFPQPAPVTEPWNLMDFGTQSDATGSERSPFTQEQRPRFFWDVENAGEGSSASRLSPLNPTIAPMGSWNSESSAALGSDIRAVASIGSGARPSNERTFSADPTTGIYASTPTVDRSGRRPGVADGRMNQGISFRAPEDMLAPDDAPGSSRTGYVYDPLNQTYHPDARRAPSSVSTPSASTTAHYTSETHRNASGSNWAQRSQGFSSAYDGEEFPGGFQGSSKDPIYAKDGKPLYWKEGIPLTYENIYLNEDGSEMSFSERVSRYDDLCRTGVLAFADIRGLPSLWRPNQAIQPQAQPPEQTRPVDAREEQRQEMIRQINERGIQVRLRNSGAQPPEQNPVHAANPPPPQIPQAPPAVPPAPPAPAPPAPAPALDQDDELEEFNVEEIDGILEVIGMRGSFWLLLQNSLLMSALICASLGVGIWIPFMIGKTILLMNPLNILRLPLALLSRLTDPILDYIFDRMLPYASGTASRAITAFNTKLSPHIGHITESYFGTVALKPLELIYEDHILPTLNAILEISVSGANQDIHSKEAIASAAGTLDLGETASNATSITVMHHAVRKWTDLAYGSASSDKFAAIMIGYVILFGVASWYFARTRYSYGHTFTKLVRDFLSQQGYILKVIHQYA
ncbi:hypothetical protein BGX26_000580 [Mortierella sp. AD094]|nr:hypothetical protein BGX26_000580 [Mortierella sp. AD094]